MVTDNNEIKRLLKYHGLPYWKVADVLGMHEITLCRKLRTPVDEELGKRIEEAITELTKESYE